MSFNSIIGVIRSVQMPFSHMSKAGRIAIAVLFLAAGIGATYVGMMVDYPVILIGGVTLCCIGFILTLPERRVR